MELFVYGTLQSGEPAHHLLSGLTPLGPARTAPGYALVCLGDYPGLILDPAAAGVSGERYHLPEVEAQARLAALDAYEGVPELYTRQPVPLTDRTLATAWILNPEAARGRPRIPHGDWRRWRPPLAPGFSR